jgi:hypothetical protein
MPSNLERKARRRKQTRLTFDPLPSSSCLDSSSPVNTRLTAAKVRYTLPGQHSSFPSQVTGAEYESEDILSSAAKGIIGSEAIGKRTRDSMLPGKSLPTPRKSSQLPVQIDLSLSSTFFYHF